ncbi:MAG: lambda-exonuclease family protein [Phycicoccus sp.]
MTASKVAAVVGLSPWESRFSLWHKMAGNISGQEETQQTRRGHYLEPAVRTWLADQHSDRDVVENTAMYVHPDVPWAAATPDGFATSRNRPDQVAVVECKTSASSDEWGPEGSSDIPPYYAAQVQWQMACIATDHALVAVLLPRHEFRDYTIVRDEVAIKLLLDAAETFMRTLPGQLDECPPSVDEHSATYTALRKLHAGIDHTIDATVPDDVTNRWRTTKLTADIAIADHALARAEVLDAMGPARLAHSTENPERVVFRRQPNGRNGISLIHLTPKETP